MAVPKRRVSKSKKKMRRSHLSQFAKPGLSVCSRCGSSKVTHRVCPTCGYYGSVEVLKMDQL